VSSADKSALYLRPAAAGAADAWTEQAAARGSVGGQRLLYAGITVPPERIAAALGLEPTDAVVLRQRLVLLDEAPTELTNSYFPLNIAGGTALAEPRKIKGGAVTLLASLGYVGSKAEETVASRPPTAAEQQDLQIAESDWVLDVFRIVTGSTGKPIEVTTMTMPAAGRTLHYTVEIG
jgi:DNA-binding GntR family transcriptional regulator